MTTQTPPETDRVPNFFRCVGTEKFQTSVMEKNVSRVKVTSDGVTTGIS